MTPPTSSASVGMSGLAFCGLKVRFDVTFPTRFMLSTWSGDQLSMLSDLTFEMWVPILRWMAAQLMQRKIPSCYCCQKSARDRSDGYSHSNSTMLVQCQHPDSRKCRVCSGLLTWIPRRAIGALVISRHFQQILQHALIASLLSLTDCTSHLVDRDHVRGWKGGIAKFLSCEGEYMRRLTR
jgi:hypothetical protein